MEEAVKNLHVSKGKSTLQLPEVTVSASTDSLMSYVSTASDTQLAATSSVTAIEAPTIKKQKTGSKEKDKRQRSVSPNPNSVNKDDFPEETKEPYLNSKNSSYRIARFSAHSRHMRYCLDRGQTPLGVTLKKVPTIWPHRRAL